MRERAAPNAQRMANSRRRARGANQQKVSDVGTGNEQHQADGAKHHEQRLARVADDAVAERLNAKLETRAGFGEFSVVLGSRQFELCVRLVQHDTGPEHPGDMKVIVHVAADRLELKRDPNVGRGVGEELFPDDANNRVWLIAEGKRFPQHALVAGKVALPHAVTQHHNLAAMG